MEDRQDSSHVLTLLLLRPTQQHWDIFLDTAPGDTTKEKFQATWRRIIETVTSPNRPDSMVAFTFQLVRHLARFECPTLLSLTGIEEQAFKHLTLELGKSVNELNPALDERILAGYADAGWFFCELFNTSSKLEEMNALKVLLGPRLIVGLFEDDADWVFFTHFYY